MTPSLSDHAGPAGGRDVAGQIGGDENIMTSLFDLPFEEPPAFASDDFLVQLHAAEVGCDSDDPTIQVRAQHALVIEYRSGLYPILPSPTSTYCPMIARLAAD